MPTGRLLSALLAAWLCSGCLARKAEEVEGRVVGMHWRVLAECLGEPHERDFDPARGDREVWRYHVSPVFSESVDLQIQVRGSLGREVTGASSTGTSGYAPADDYCRFEFALEGEAVVSVRAEGRDPAGMNADVRCMRKLRPCVPEREELR